VNLWRVVTYSGTVIGVATGALTLYFLARPLWHHSPAPTANGSLSGVSIERPVTFGSYLGRVGATTRASYSPGQLEQVGVEVDYKATTEGYAGEKLSVRANLVDVATGAIVDERSLIFAPAPDRVVDAGGVPVWFPLRRSGRFRVEILLFDPGGVVRLDAKKTGIFRGISKLRSTPSRAR
jgi:hypothetical protein